MASLQLIVHCRIGSLESKQYENKYLRNVHCRIGSLERKQRGVILTARVHCRIGSLEKLVCKFTAHTRFHFW